MKDEIGSAMAQVTSFEEAQALIDDWILITTTMNVDNGCLQSSPQMNFMSIAIPEFIL